MLKVGIVGLPNVGKSTLFKAITNAEVLIENYPFATIKPNIKTVNVADERLTVMAQLFNSEKIVPTVIELHDIAGLVKGAHEGQGLGNEFLGNIRNVDAICEVVRCFEDTNIMHVEERINPVEDHEIIFFELVSADQVFLQKYKTKNLKRLQMAKDKDSKLELAVLLKLEQQLNENYLIDKTSFNAEEWKIVASYNLLCAKPLILVANINENDLMSATHNQHLAALQTFAKSKNIEVIVLCSKLEEEISALSIAEKQEFLQELGIKFSGLEKLVFSAYQLLNLKTFFTAGPKEVHAWTFNDGMVAPQCAGIIHSDFERGFIRAEVYNYRDLLACHSEKGVKEKGLFRVEGKNYVMEDGDICHFRFNV